MTRPSSEERIGAFFDARGQHVTEHKYLRLDPDGPFTYIFSPQSSGISLLVDRLRGAGLKRRVATTAFRSGKLAPTGLRALPGVSSTTVRTPRNNAFDLVIASARQLTLLAPSDGIAATVGWPDDNRVAKEIDTRRKIPDNINVPRLVDTDDTFPYFVTEYIEGRTIQNPVEDWDHVLDALVQLRKWYESAAVTWIDTEKAIEELHAGLAGLEDDPTIDAAFQRLRELPLPERFARGRTHGDLHGENLRIDGGRVYILDWESAECSFLFRDFVLPFLQWTRYGGNPAVFDDLLEVEAAANGIGSQYAEWMGSVAWNSTEWYPGIVLFGLLRELVIRSRSGENWKRTYDTLDALETLRKGE